MLLDEPWRSLEEFETYCMLAYDVTSLRDFCLLSLIHFPFSSQLPHKNKKKLENLELIVSQEVVSVFHFDKLARTRVQ